MSLKPVERLHCTKPWSRRIRPAAAPSPPASRPPSTPTNPAACTSCSTPTRSWSCPPAKYNQMTRHLGSSHMPCSFTFAGCSAESYPDGSLAATALPSAQLRAGVAAEGTDRTRYTRAAPMSAIHSKCSSCTRSRYNRPEMRIPRGPRMSQGARNRCATVRSASHAVARHHHGRPPGRSRRKPAGQ